MMISRRFVVRFLFVLGLTSSPLLLAAHETRADQFFIFGYVTSPGAYVLDRETTVGGAIDQAGGFSAGQHVSSVEIIRIVDGQKQSSNVKLSENVLPNDTIRVK